MTWNPSDKSPNISLSNGDTTATAGSTAWKSVRAVQGRSTGKYYFELVLGTTSANSSMVGVGANTVSLTNHLGFSAVGWAYYNYSAGQKWNNNFSQAFGDTYTTGDVIGVAVDLDAGKIWWSKNGVWQASGDPAAGTNEAYSGLSGTLYPTYSPYTLYDNATLAEHDADFNYTPPTGFIGWADELFTLTGNITESLDITDWRVSAYKCSDGTLSATDVVTGTSYALTLFNQGPHNINIAPKIDYVWEAGLSVLTGNFIVASAPDTTQHLFKVTVGGTTGVTEPTWNLSGTTVEGAITYTYVAPLVDPVTIGPKIPS